jgi:hypothetical protein
MKLSCRINGLLHINKSNLKKNHYNEIEVHVPSEETTSHVYIYMSGIVFDSFSTIGYWNFSDDVIFFACSHFRLGIGTVPTM